jgi:hypothetical protein
MKNMFKPNTRFEAISDGPFFNEEKNENRDRGHFKEDNFKRTNENNTFSQKVNDKALEQQKTNEMQRMIEIRNKNLSIDNFPEMKLSGKNPIKTEVNHDKQIISFSEKVKQINNVVEKSVNHIPYGWIVIKRDPITKKQITECNKEYEKDLKRAEKKEKEQWPLKVLDALVDLYEKERDRYIDKWGYNAYEKKYLDPDYDDEYFDRLDEEYDRNNTDDEEEYDEEYDEQYDEQNYYWKN